MLNNFNLKLKINLPILVLSVFAGFVGLTGLSTLNKTLSEGHVAKVQAQVESALSIAQVNYDRFLAGEMNEDEAKTRARDAIRAMVFNNGARVFVFDRHGVRVVSHAAFAEGTSALGGPHTLSMIKLALSGGGVTYYSGHRELNGVMTNGVPKAAWSQYFAPWGWIIASAVYIDDVRAAFWRGLAELAVQLGLVGLAVAFASNAITRNLTEPLLNLTANMRQLAKGNTDVVISGQGRGDEIGEMADAMETFLEHEKHRQDLQDQLREQAYRDHLTGLANRAQFADLLRTEIETAVRTETQCALMILDLDRFKAINDNLGHLVGDSVLVEFAQRLQKAVGYPGVVGRLSGDEFYVILSGSEVPELVEDVAMAVLDGADIPFEADGNSVTFSASIGVAFAPKDSLSDSMLYRFADMALYEVKLDGGAGIRHYTSSMSEKALRRFELEGMIKEGLRETQFRAHFQSKVNLATGGIVGAEALCRWHHPDEGLISPADFIQIAEDTGQIIEIGYQMLLQACTFAVECNKICEEPFIVAVNVSPRQLLYGGFRSMLDGCLQRTSCSPSWIELEITESLLLTDLEETVSLLNSIARMGVLITIDDFGTGYSAMNYLSRFPFKCLKIDQSFVREMASDREKEVLVRAMLAMAQGLGLKTVAEGVETQEAASILAELNCDYGQGYLWHKPGCRDQFLTMLRDARAA